MGDTIKHSPKPWKTRRNKRNTHVYISSEHWGNFAKIVVRMNDCYYDDEIGLANARLIAAAPELLETCIEALQYHQGGHSKIGFKLREVIAKATVYEIEKHI